MTTKQCFFTYVFFVLFLHIIIVPAAGAANKIMPLGDSITQGITSGVAVEAFQVSYRKTLYEKLKASGYVVNDEIFVGTLFSGESVADLDPDHEGHSGWRADEIIAGRTGSGEGILSDWLIAEEPNIVLLHIGTNDVSNANEDWTEVSDILDVIDDYEFTSGTGVWVILSLIVDRSCNPFLPPCANSMETTNFNNNVRDLVFFPRQAGGDNIVLVDMQNGAGINYDRWDMGGDMWDDVHPFATGYAKMADLWFTALLDILPQADAGPDQSVDEFDSVKLDASESSDPKHGTLSYQWVQTAGTAVDLSDAQAVQPTFVAPAPGSCGKILTFRVTVTDEDELESSDTVNIEVGSTANCPFEDIPAGYWAEEAIYAIYDAGITAGCAANPLRYCPENIVTRAQMAIFLGRAKHGSNFTPPQTTGIFEDVPVGYWAADWIEQFYNDGITAGCISNPLGYCPATPVTRAQMAIFLLRSKHGSNYTPPQASGIFADVAVGSFAADWIEDLYNKGITTGCKTNPLWFCPNSSVTRAQMAVFLVRTFGP